MLSDDAELVSVNDHLVEPADLWTSRVPRQVRDQAPSVVEVAGGAEDGWRFGSDLLPFSLLSVPARKEGLDVVVAARRVDEVWPAVHEPAARLAAMDADGVAVHTVMPHVCGFAGERLRLCGDSGLWELLVGAYNDFVLEEFCAADPDRLFGVALLPLADPRAAVAEIDRVAGLGAVAVSFPNDPRLLGLPPIGSDAWTPVFDAATDAGLAVFVHLGSSGHAWDGSDVEGDPLGAFLTMVNFDVMATTTRLALSGVLYRHPDLRFVMLEGGAGWLPYLRERMDFFWERRSGVTVPGAPADLAPSELVDRSVWTSLIDDPSAIRERVVIGVDRMLWQSDFPHSDSYWPNSRPRLAALLAEVPDDEAAAIAGGNARRLLGRV